MNKQVIYLDNNATTQIDERVLDAMMPFLKDNFANANSTHLFGVESHEAVKKARRQVADLISAETNEMVFTSGATEAINLAIKGVAENYEKKGKHIITVSTEHYAVLDTCKYLETKGFEVTYLPVANDGLINIEDVKLALRHDTILVTVMYANNETGVLQNIQEIAEIAHAADAYFMTDATQAVGKIPIDVDNMGIDLMCMSGHKLYGPKGIGALYIRQRNNRIKLPALIHGGGHERGLRSGTLNVPGIVGLGAACAIAKKEMRQNEQHIKALRDYLENELLQIEDTSLNGNKKHRLYNTTNILFKDVDSDAMIMGLSNMENDLPLIAVSNGSACTSASIEPSHVLTAMGLNEIDSFSSIRFSIGKFSRIEQIYITIEVVKKCIYELREMILPI
ncbi:cysteine desulfurase family protein [Parafilimonas terrae]|uniref:cysteine desulfurase n=1 Tax=Parafilimonas terrae TaxID=1465490 RepID=A0A1I5VJL4_9BACT|nr:cysteine desulfurase family protein [Parafilimonas terrae]SFQ07497.1 cysteine desulfurase IscS [Parafilimonas terrae]